MAVAVQHMPSDVSALSSNAWPEGMGTISNGAPASFQPSQKDQLSAFMTNLLNSTFQGHTSVSDTGKSVLQPSADTRMHSSAKYSTPLESSLSADRSGVLNSHDTSSSNTQGGVHQEPCSIPPETQITGHSMQSGWQNRVNKAQDNKPSIYSKALNAWLSSLSGSPSRSSSQKVVETSLPYGYKRVDAIRYTPEMMKTAEGRAQVASEQSRMRSLVSSANASGTGLQAVLLREGRHGISAHNEGQENKSNASNYHTGVKPVYFNHTDENGNITRRKYNPACPIQNSWMRENTPLTDAGIKGCHTMMPANNHTENKLQLVSGLQRTLQTANTSTNGNGCSQLNGNGWTEMKQGSGTVPTFRSNFFNETYWGNPLHKEGKALYESLDTAGKAGITEIDLTSHGNMLGSLTSQGLNLPGWDRFHENAEQREFALIREDPGTTLDRSDALASIGKILTDKRRDPSEYDDNTTIVKAWEPLSDDDYQSGRVHAYEIGTRPIEEGGETIQEMIVTKTKDKEEYKNVPVSMQYGNLPEYLRSLPEDPN